MPLARKYQISITDTPYYHVVSRCVRRTFLCGKDHKTGEDYEHRRQWIVDRIRLLSSLFSIDILSYAVMSNHYHIVVKLCPEAAGTWSMDEVIHRWLSLFRGPRLAQRYSQGEPLSAEEMRLLVETSEQWRARLTDLSWFMRLLNEPIARQANKEDQCTGHFWESRFKSDPLLTEEALLTCMAYVDLNPIRAAMAQTPEASDYTSIQERISPKANLDSMLENEDSIDTYHMQRFTLKPLAPFDGNITENPQLGIPFSFKDYLILVDTTGRIQRHGKRGFIPATFEPILARLQISQDTWLNNTRKFEEVFQRTFGRRRTKAA